MSLQTAMESVRAALNTELVPSVFPNMISMSPKHPDYIKDSDQFPYFCMLYAGERLEYTEGSTDIRWINPSQKNAFFLLWIVAGKSETESLSVDLLALVEQVKATITKITSDRTNRFRVRVDSVDPPDYDPGLRWALAKITIVIGSY